MTTPKEIGLEFKVALDVGSVAEAPGSAITTTKAAAICLATLTYAHYCATSLGIHTKPTHAGRSTLKALSASRIVRTVNALYEYYVIPSASCTGNQTEAHTSMSGNLRH
jgi:hypothetical protein